MFLGKRSLRYTTALNPKTSSSARAGVATEKSSLLMRKYPAIEMVTKGAKPQGSRDRSMAIFMPRK